MKTMTILKEVSESLGVSQETFLWESFTSYLRERKRLLMAERFDMLSRYGVDSPDKLKGKITSGEVPEHPTWEDYIELTNLEDELASLEDHLHSVEAKA